MPEFKVKITKRESYMYVTYIEALDKDDALNKAINMEREEPIDSRKNTYLGADVDYTITERPL